MLSIVVYGNLLQDPFVLSLVWLVSFIPVTLSISVPIHGLLHIKLVQVQLQILIRLLLVLLICLLPYHSALSVIEHFHFMNRLVFLN